MSDRAIDAIKGAILLERRGQAFYRRVAETSKSDAVSEVFSTMADEEKRHEEVLEQHYSSLVRDGRLAAIGELGEVKEHAAEMLTQNIRQQVEAAGYEAAAISAAMALEKEAETYYSQKRDQAESDVERDLYDWLSRWEHGHLEMLGDMDRALQKEIWFENRFWPEI
ncbi:MAG: ferritin-like domain-containing protein [Candidatus Fermentibacterota bacterium]